MTYEDFEWLMGINLWGVVYGVKAFLPLLRQRPEGHIVNISSINGMVPFPENGPYDMAKYAVGALSETLVQVFKRVVPEKAVRAAGWLVHRAKR